MNFLDILLRRHQGGVVKGFSGITHLLSSLALFFLLFLIPVGPLTEFVNLASSDIKYFIVLMIVLAGASILPDLDNDVSTAEYTLGFIGSIIKTFMKTVAFIIFNLYHLKNDRTPPPSMHRLFWHTPFVAIVMIVYFMFWFPTGNHSFFDLSKMLINKDVTLATFLIQNTSVVFLICLAYVCTLLGSSILLYWPLKIIPVSGKMKSLINNVLPIVVMVIICTMSMSQLKFIGVSIGLGYLFHILGDLVSQGSVPIIWPIPVKKKAYWMPWVLGPFQIYTGGIVNTILNFVFIAINILLVLAIIKL